MAQKKKPLPTGTIATGELKKSLKDKLNKWEPTKWDPGPVPLPYEHQLAAVNQKTLWADINTLQGSNTYPFVDPDPFVVDSNAYVEDIEKAAKAVVGEKVVQFGEFQILPSYYLAPGEVAITNSSVAKQTSAPAAETVVNGKKIAPSVTKLHQQVMELMSTVVTLTHKVEKLTSVAETAYAMVQSQQQTIQKLQNQLMSHYHQLPTVQVNGTYIPFPPGSPAVING